MGRQEVAAQRFPRRLPAPGSRAGFPLRGRVDPACEARDCLRAGSAAHIPIRQPVADTHPLHHRGGPDTTPRQATHRVLREAERVPAGPMKPLIIGIAGGTGSGKTTVAQKVAEALSGASVGFLEMDSYYRDFRHLSMEQLNRVNWDHPDAVDMSLLVEHLRALSRGEGVDTPIYQFATHSRAAETHRIEPADVVVIDGILLLSDAEIRALCEVKVFVDADADIRLVRRIRRDTLVRGRTLESVLDQYVNTVQPMHLQFVEPSKRYADVIVPRGGSNTVAIEMIVAKIQRRLGARATLRGAAAPIGAPD
jgi:uridine kinase